MFFLDIADLRIDTVAHVHRLTQVTDGQARNRQLFFFTLGNETVFQVIMFHTAQLLDRTETAMVVGEDQSLLGDGDTRASPAEDDHGVRHAGLILVIQLVNRKLEAQLGHAGQVLLVQLLHDPHTLVGVGGQGDGTKT